MAATAMVRRFNHLPLGEAKIQLVEFDCAVFTETQWDIFLCGVRRWILQGAFVDYIQLTKKPSELTQSRTRELVSVGDGLVWHYKPSPQMELDADQTNLYDHLETTHPIVVQMKSGKALWLEGFHPPTSHIVRDVSYIAPGDLEHDQVNIELFEQCQHWISSLQPVLQLDTANYTHIT